MEPGNTDVPQTLTVQPFTGPDPFFGQVFPDKLAARQAIADELRLPLAKLRPEDLSFIGQLLDETLSRTVILAAIHERFPAGRKGGYN